MEQCQLQAAGGGDETYDSSQLLLLLLFHQTHGTSKSRDIIISIVAKGTNCEQNCMIYRFGDMKVKPAINKNDKSS